jgi:hypothetical protein
MVDIRENLNNQLRWLISLFELLPYLRNIVGNGHKVDYSHSQGLGTIKESKNTSL